MSPGSKTSHSGADSFADKTSKTAKQAGVFGEAMWDDCAKNFSKMPGIDFEALMATHRKNMDTIRQAQQTASELLQSLVNLNSHYMRSSFEDLGSQVKTFSGSSPQDGAAKATASAASVKASFDRSISHCKQVTDLFSQSAAKVFDCYRKRFDEGLTEAQSFMKKASA